MTVKAPNSQQKIEPKETVSVRDSIRAAMDEETNKQKEVDEKEEKEDTVDETTEEKKVEEPKEEDTSKPVEVKEEDTEEDTKEKEEKPEKVSTPKEKKGGSQPIPYGLTKEIRSKWTDYDDETQQFITKSIKDANDAKAAAGRVSQDMREVDAVLTPYRPSIQRNGVTAAQVVKKVLEYTDGLAGPNKYQTLQQIAADFDIDLTRFGNQSKPTLAPNQNQTDAVDDITIDLPPEVHQKLDRILANHEQNSQAQAEAQRAANQKAAEDTVHSWSGFNAATGSHDKKPYFPYVRHSMFALMQANPNLYLKGNTVDLDKAYDDACYADGEIRELMVENDKLAKQKQAQELRDKKAKQIAAAKAKNVSLKPSASSISAPQRNALNGKGQNKNGPVSVRDSIMSAIQENR